MPIPYNYQESIVTPKASRHVEAYWSFSAPDAGEAIVLPDGRCDIILRFNLHTEDAPTPIITGPGTQAYTVNYKAGDSWIGLRLRPNKACLLWHNNIRHAADQVLRGADAIALLPELKNIERPNATAASLATTLDTSELLLQNHRSDGKVAQAIDTLHITGGRLGVDDLASSVQYSSRHLNRLFQTTVGLSVKLYSQLIQFHRTLSLIQHAQLPVTDAALEGGYADHAHLTRAFQRFGGFSPSRTPHDLSLPGLFSV